MSVLAATLPSTSCLPSPREDVVGEALGRARLFEDSHTDQRTGEEAEDSHSVDGLKALLNHSIRDEKSDDRITSMCYIRFATA